jgi:hypothetical protein
LGVAAQRNRNARALKSNGSLLRFWQRAARKKTSLLSCKSAPQTTLPCVTSRHSKVFPLVTLARGWFGSVRFIFSRPRFPTFQEALFPANLPLKSFKNVHFSLLCVFKVSNFVNWYSSNFIATRFCVFVRPSVAHTHIHTHTVTKTHTHTHTHTHTPSRTKFRLQDTTDISCCESMLIPTPCLCTCGESPAARVGRLEPLHWFHSLLYIFIGFVGTGGPPIYETNR